MSVKYYGDMLKGYFSEMIGKGEEFSNNRRFTLGMSVIYITLINLSGGAFLTGLLVVLKADNTLIGLANSIPLFSSILQIFAPVFLDKFENKKKIIIIFGVIHLISYSVGIGLISLLPIGYSFKTTLILIVLFVSFLSWSIVAPGFGIWHLKSMPKEIRAQFFTFNNTVIIIISQVALIFSGFLVDKFKDFGHELLGFTVLRFACVAPIIFFVLFGRKLKDYAEEAGAEKLSLIKSIVLPLKNKLYVQILKLTAIWVFNVFFIGPYFLVYMLKDLNVSLGFINTVGLANLVVNIVLMPYIPKILHKIGIVKSYPRFLLLYSLVLLTLPFLDKSTVVVGYAIVQTFAFIIIAMITNIFANLPFLYLPRKDSRSYISSYNTSNAIFSSLGSILGVQFISLTNNIDINILGVHMKNNRYIVLVGFLMCVVGSFYARHIVKRIDVLKQGFDEQN